MGPGPWGRRDGVREGKGGEGKELIGKEGIRNGCERDRKGEGEREEKERCLVLRLSSGCAPGLR